MGMRALRTNSIFDKVSYIQILRVPYSNACFEKVRKGKIMKLLDSISELISNIDIPEI